MEAKPDCWRAPRGTHETEDGGGKPNLSDLTDKGGNFEVKPVQTAHNCTITTFDTGTGGTAIVYVDCYLLGSLTDTYFDLTATRAGTIKHGLLDYAWVSSKNKTYKLSGQDLFNSAHKSSTVKHLGTGRYEVTFAGKAKTTNTGTVKVSPYGFGDGNCQASWHGGSTATTVHVDCFGYRGHRQNREFLLVYARNHNILGDVQVTTTGSTYARCTPYSYSQGSNPSALITCYDALGGAINASFSVQWLLG